MPWAFTTTASSLCSILMILGILWSMIAATASSTVGLVRKHAPRWGLFLNVFIGIGLLSIVSTASYVRGARRLLQLDDSVISTFQYFPEQISEEKNASGEMGHLYLPTTVRLNRLILGLWIKAALMFSALMISILVFVRHRAVRDSEATFFADNRRVILGGAGMVCLVVHLFI